MLSVEDTKDLAKEISMSRHTVVSGNSIRSASSFFAPEEDSSPSRVSLTRHLAW